MWNPFRFAFVLGLSLAVVLLGTEIYHKYREMELKTHRNKSLVIKKKLVKSPKTTNFMFFVVKIIESSRSDHSFSLYNIYH